MKNYYITVRSVTYAQRGERILTRAGIRCSVQRTPKWMEKQGCGYGLRVWTKDIRSAVSMLQEAQLPIRKIYAQREDGKLEELLL